MKLREDLTQKMLHKNVAEKAEHRQDVTDMAQKEIL